MNVILLQKGDELYVFSYDDAAESVAALVETTVRFAADSGLSFAWQDAVGICDAQQRMDRVGVALRNLMGSE